MKFLLVVVVIVGVLWWMLRRPRATHKNTEATRVSATFVACAHCGLHLPSGDALREGELHYCSDAHRLAGPRDRNPQ